MIAVNLLSIAKLSRKLLPILHNTWAMIVRSCYSVEDLFPWNFEDSENCDEEKEKS